MKVVEGYSYVPADLRADRLWNVCISVIVTCQAPRPFCEGDGFFSCGAGFFKLCDWFMSPNWCKEEKGCHSAGSELQGKVGAKGYDSHKPTAFWGHQNKYSPGLDYPGDRI